MKQNTEKKLFEINKLSLNIEIKSFSYNLTMKTRVLKNYFPAILTLEAEAFGVSTAWVIFHTHDVNYLNRIFFYLL